MVEPFSISASAASFVSLGIQVCHELVLYCNAWAQFEEDAVNTAQKMNGLKFTLEALQEILPMVASLDSNAGAALQPVDDHIFSCNESLEMLRMALVKFQSIIPLSGLRRSMQSFKKHVAYPFRKDMLRELQDTVTAMQTNLQSAVQVLELHVQSHQGKMLTSLNGVVKSQALFAKVQIIHDKLLEISDISTELTLLPNTIETVIIRELSHHGDRL